MFHKEAFQLDQYTDEAHWSFYRIELINDGVVIRCHEAGTQSSAKVFLIFLLIYLLLRISNQHWHLYRRIQWSQFWLHQSAFLHKMQKNVCYIFCSIACWHKVARVVASGL